jgi:ABC-2 type transport system ATP-binding protein
MSTAIIRTTGLTKRFGDFTAVDDLSIAVEPGTIFAFLGGNGSGKSTTIRMLIGLLRPTAGTIEVDGIDVIARPRRVRDHIGYMGQKVSLYQGLSLRENVEFYAGLFGLEGDALERRWDALRERFALADAESERPENLPAAIRQRAGLALSMLHSPRVLFLDEPTVGLDPQTRAAIWGYINELKETEDITIFLTTHYMEEAEYCDRIAIIDHGEIVVLDTPESLKASVGKDRVQIATADDEAAIAALKERFAIDAGIHERAVTFAVPSGEEFVPRLFAELGVPIRSVHVARPSLDDVFLNYTGSTIRDAEGGSMDWARGMMRR